MKENKDFNFLLYRAEDDDVSVNAVIKDETIWLTQKSMAELFDCTPDNISLHLKNIYASNELSEESTAEIFSVVHTEGSRKVRRAITFYNLDAIISVGYRVNSRRATQFRIWATGILKEYMIKGFALDDDRLKQGQAAFGHDFFRELLERVRSIRASERRIWQQITDIFAECSIDRENTFTMEEFAASVNEFLEFRRYEILPDKGRVSAKTAREKAEAEYDVFNKAQHIESDFDKEIAKLLADNDSAGK